MQTKMKKKLWINKRKDKVCWFAFRSFSIAKKNKYEMKKEKSNK